MCQRQQQRGRRIVDGMVSGSVADRGNERAERQRFGGGPRERTRGARGGRWFGQQDRAAPCRTVRGADDPRQRGQRPRRMRAGTIYVLPLEREPRRKSLATAFSKRCTILASMGEGGGGVAGSSEQR